MKCKMRVCGMDNGVLVTATTICGFLGRSIKKYWLHLLVFIGAFSYFLWMTAPDITWVNADCDGTIYLGSAKYAVLSFAQGSPLYNMLNWVAVRIPIGAEFWRLSAVSALASGITALLLFVIARRYTPSRIKALVAPLVFCASGVVVSQATILDSYSLTTMLSVLAFYLHLTDKVKSKYLVLALGIGIHHLILFPLAYIWLADVAKRHKAKQKMFRPAMFLPALGFLFYIWIFAVNRPPYNLISGDTLRDYATYFFGQGSLIGGLAMSSANEVIRRAQDATLILSIGFGLSTLMIFPTVWKHFKTKGIESIDNKILALLYISPIIYYVTDKDPQTYVYTVPAFAFGGLLAVQGIEWLTHRERETSVIPPLASHQNPQLLFIPTCRDWWGNWRQRVKYRIRSGCLWVSGRLRRNYRLQYAISIGIGLCSIGLMVYNTQVYDIGKNLDPNLIATQYQGMVSEIPDGDYVYALCAISSQSIWLYNHGGGDIHPIPIGYRRPVNESLVIAQQAYDEGKLWVVEESYPDGILLQVTQHKVTPETSEVDLANIAKACTPTQPYDGSKIKTGWVNPTDLITGKQVYTRWATVSSSNLTAGYVVMWAFAGLYSLDFTYAIWGRKVKSKTKLQLLNIITVAILVGLLVVICMVSGMKMIWMR